MNSAVFFVWRRFAQLALVLFVAACATTPEEPHNLGGPRPPRDSITKFSVRARAIISQPDQANTIRMIWQHTARDDYLGFANPLGHMMAELQRDASGARWLTADGERYEAPQPDQLFAQLTSVPVPLDAFSQWMLGRVTNAAQAVQRDAEGRLVDASDRGWHVHVQKYESALPDALPEILELEQDKLRIRLAVEDWQL